MNQLRNHAWAILLGAAVAGGGIVSGHAQDGAVDDERLHAAAEDDANWINFGRGYRNYRYSPLDDINRDTVAGLAPAWIYQTGIVNSTQPQPIVVDGVIYFTTSGNDVVAADAATGDPIWRYRHVSAAEQGVNEGLSASGNQRGVAIAYGRVYVPTIDRRVIALDQKTGEVIWDKPIAGWEPSEDLLLPDRPAPGPAGVRFRAPPIIYDGLLITSTCCPYGPPIGGLESFVEEQLAAGRDPAQEWIHRHLGMRGFVLALDAETGEEVWRFYMTKEGGWEGEYAEQSASGEDLNRDFGVEQDMAASYPNAWAAGGTSSIWTPAIDEETGIVYLGTGDPEGPFPNARPGDNHYSNGMLALDAATGEMKWFTQVRPHDNHSDLISTATLFEANVDGQTVQAVGAASKTGHFHAFNRATGEYLYQSEPIVRQINVFQEPTTEGIVKAPGTSGGVSISPSSYDPNSGYLYVAAMDVPQLFKRIDVPGFDHIYFEDTSPAPDIDPAGTLTAIDIRNGGKIAWQVTTEERLQGGPLATGGGLVFMGEIDGYFRAYNSETGEELWSFQTGAAIRSSYVTYSVDGRQYVAVTNGSAMPRAGQQIESDDYRPGSAVISFALPTQ